MSTEALAARQRLASACAVAADAIARLYPDGIEPHQLAGSVRTEMLEATV